MKPVGIEKIGAYGSTAALPMRALAEARGASAAYVHDELMIDERAVLPPWEDPVTMAVHAAMSVLTDEDRRAIELLLVCSESGVDQEKPMSTWVQRYLGLPSTCRNLEVKHACYSGTGALHLAASWVRAGPRPGKKALVITTDQSRMHLGRPWEYVLGAGACALLVSDEPDFLEIDLAASGVHTEEVSDLTRPTSRVETGNAETSLVSYLNAVQEAYDRLCETIGPVDIERDFRWNVYHVPFGGLTLRAHRGLLRRASVSAEHVAASFEARVRPTLTYTRRMGGTYASSTFIALLGLVDATTAAPGEVVSVFSYGSGCCSEMYRARLGPRAREVAAAAGLGAALSARRVLSVAEYEAIEHARDGYVDQGDYEPATAAPAGLYDAAYAGRRRLVFRGLREHVRRYEWSA